MRPPASPSWLRGFGLIALATALVAPVWTRGTDAASRPPVRGQRAMVVSVDARATDAGVSVLRRGGNAVDAAVAVALTLAVVYPEAGNLGGGGFLLYRDPRRGYHALDFRETAPRRLTREMFLDERGRPRRQLSRVGGLAVAVPGTVAGLVEMHRRWGSRPWEELFEPALRLAREGFDVSPRLAAAVAAEQERLQRDASAAALLLPAGVPVVRGQRVVRPALTRTLERIRDHRSDGFYRGPVAQAIVLSVARAGGVLEAEDLAGYRVIEREPLIGSYRGHPVATFPPPSAGGIVLLQMLGMLDRFDLARSGFGSSITVHRLAEVKRRAYADRSMWLGDPDFFRVPVEQLLDPDYLCQRAATIRDRRATPSKKVRPGRLALPREGQHTTHLSVADAHGGAVALTTTLNSRFGAALVAEGTGVFLNNEIDDFALAPGVANQFGLLGAQANAVRAAKRPLSSMSPTIVEFPHLASRPRLVLGSPGGSAITTSVLQVIVNVIDHGMSLSEAVEAPRFHHQWLPDRIEHEPRAFPSDVARALSKRGHVLHLRPSLGNVSAISVDEEGSWLGAADPRRGGRAGGF